MRFDRTIGWLIFGVLVCMSSVEDSNVQSGLSTIALGLVFIAVWVLKQKFVISGTGWFIAGGVLLAFIVEYFPDPEMIYPLVIAAVCLYMFYRSNREEFDFARNGGYEQPFPEEEFPEEFTEDEFPGEGYPEGADFPDEDFPDEGFPDDTGNPADGYEDAGSADEEDVEFKVET